jgi:glycerophosphoryl diester phosphodiesterase
VSRYIAGTEHVPCVGRALSTPAVIAHRGAADDAPENTLAAFMLAWQQGADGIEGDFHLTRDGKIVCIHDADITRTASLAGQVAEATLAELRQLDVGSWKGEQWRGARIPALDEVLATVPEGKQVFIGRLKQRLCSEAGARGLSNQEPQAPNRAPGRPR